MTVWEVRAVKYPLRGLTFQDAARYESSTAGSRKAEKKATVLALGYDAMMC
jgi:hypothetical protein